MADLTKQRKSGPNGAENGGSKSAPPIPGQTAMKQFAIGVLVGLVAAAGLYTASHCGRPTPGAGPTQLRYSKRPAPPRLTVPPVAWRRYLYRVRVDTVTYCVPVPVDLSPTGIIGPDPVDIRRSHLALRYWSPDSLRWVVDKYRLPERPFGLWVTAEAGIHRVAWAGAHLNIRRRRVTASLGAIITQEGHPALSVGVRYNLFGFR